MADAIYLFDNHTETSTLELIGSHSFVIVAKKDCETCTMIGELLRKLSDRTDVLLITQDDPDFPAPGSAEFDTGLEASFHLGVETVPTLIRFVDGIEVERAVGWSRTEWRRVLDDPNLGDSFSEYRPGCGSLSVDFNYAEHLALAHSTVQLSSRRVEVSSLTDEWEAAYERGWSDGLPVVPPTPLRVHRMLSGTSMSPDDLVANVPPNLTPATVEKIAINAVMAGAKSEYLPVIIAAVRALASDQFNGHGLLATTYPASPVIIVNGPVARRIGMNHSTNALGQGNRANATIGRAVQLVVRNVGGGLPGGIDRAALGGPGKYTFCFAEDEERSPWGPISEELGIDSGRSSVTLFAGEGPRAMVDQISRTPDSLARSFASCLRSVGHPKLAIAFDALVVVCPEHGEVFKQAGWSRQRLRDEVNSHLLLDPVEVARGANGIEEGLLVTSETPMIPKFRAGMPLFAFAGGGAGKFSAIIGGWVSGSAGSTPISVEIIE